VVGQRLDQGPRSVSALPVGLADRPDRKTGAEKKGASEKCRHKIRRFTSNEKTFRTPSRGRPIRRFALPNNRVLDKTPKRDQDACQLYCLRRAWLDHSRRSGGRAGRSSTRRWKGQVNKKTVPFATTASAEVFICRGTIQAGRLIGPTGESVFERRGGRNWIGGTTAGRKCGSHLPTGARSSYLRTRRDIRARRSMNRQGPSGPTTITSGARDEGAEVGIK